MPDAVSNLPIEPVIQDTEVLASTISPVLFGGMVMIIILSNHAVFSEIVQWIHIHFTMPIRDKKGPWMARPFLYLTMVLILTSHLVDIVIWGYALVWSGLVTDISQALYFSGSTYTTLGYGEDIMPPAWNAITAVIALSGMFCIAWTTSVLMSIITVFHPHRLKAPKEKPGA